MICPPRRRDNMSYPPYGRDIAQPQESVMIIASRSANSFPLPIYCEMPVQPGRGVVEGGFRSGFWGTSRRLNSGAKALLYAGGLRRGRPFLRQGKKARPSPQNRIRRTGPQRLKPCPDKDPACDRSGFIFVPSAMARCRAEGRGATLKSKSRPATTDVPAVYSCSGRACPAIFLVSEKRGDT